MLDMGDAVPTPSFPTPSTLICQLWFLTNAWVSVEAFFACSCPSTNTSRERESIKKVWPVWKQFFMVADWPWAACRISLPELFNRSRCPVSIFLSTSDLELKAMMSLNWQYVFVDGRLTSRPSCAFSLYWLISLVFPLGQFHDSDPGPKELASLWN